LNFGFHKLCKPVTLCDIKKHFDGPLIGNITYTKETAEGAIRSGAADLIAFGRAYISNPDLVERFQNNWPLAEDASYADWYGRTPNAEDSLQGYNTFKPYQG
jgi:2,4-dienoyl-CoA reductase-like NADH-dependent reductase (Old Yellow Enzyme family)